MVDARLGEKDPEKGSFRNVLNRPDYQRSWSEAGATDGVSPTFDVFAQIRLSSLFSMVSLEKRVRQMGAERGAS